jgi:hypothetical protein
MTVGLKLNSAWFSQMLLYVGWKAVTNRFLICPNHRMHPTGMAVAHERRINVTRRHAGG